MRARSFATERIDQGGAAVLAYRIDCACCGAVGYFALKRGGVPRPPRSVVIHFQAEGWRVGAAARKDACPACCRPDPAVRAPLPPVSTGETAMPDPHVKTIDLVPAKADAPREPRLEDRRIINLKLSECYGDGGYATPWTDQRVADDLGVPRAWVSEIRETMYGPEGSNPLYDQFLAACAEIATAQDELMTLRKEHFELVKRAQESGDRVRRRCDDLDGKLGELRLLAKRVEKEIGR